MNNRTKRLLSMVVAIAMMITSLNVPTLADGLWVGSDDVISGASISISNYSTNPISEETVFAPDLDPDVSTYGTPAAVTGFYQINDIALLGSEERPASIDAGWYSYEDGESFEYAARTLGASSDQGGFITFAVESAAKVTVYAAPTGSGRAIGLISGVPSGEVTEDDFEDYQYDDSVQSNIYDFNAVTPGQYSIAATSGYDISKVVVTPIDDDEVIITANAEQVASANAITDGDALAAGTYDLTSNSPDDFAGMTVTTSTSSSSGSKIRGYGGTRYIDLVAGVSGSLKLTVASGNDKGIAIYTVNEGTLSTVASFSSTTPTNSVYTYDGVVLGTQYRIYSAGGTSDTTYLTTIQLVDSSATSTDITPTITQTDGESTVSGTVTLSDTDGAVSTVTAGSSYTLTATAENYTVSKVEATGATVTSNEDGTYTIEVASDAEAVTITVTYAAASSSESSTEAASESTTEAASETTTNASTGSSRVWDFSSNETLNTWTYSSSSILDSGDGLTFKAESTSDVIQSTDSNGEGIEGVSAFTKYLETGGTGNSSKRYFTISDAKAGDTVTIYYSSSSSTRTISINSNGSDLSLTTLENTGDRGKVYGTPITYTVDNDGDTSFYFSSTVGVYYISITSSGSTATTSNAVITIVNDVSSTLTDLTGLTITATPESGSSKTGSTPTTDETTGAITSTIEGLIVDTTYNLAVSGLSAIYKAVFYPTSLTISETEDNTATLTISDADKVIYTFTLSDESATVTLTNTADSTDTYTVDSTNNTANLVAGATYRVTVSSGYTVSSIEADDSTTVDGSTITASTETTGTATITVAEEEAVEFKQVLDPSQATDQTLASGSEVLINNYFKISAGSITGSYPAIDNSSTGKTVTLADENYSYTKGFVNTSGAGDSDKRYISFTPTSLGTIYVYGIANSGTDTRTAYMVYTDGTAVEGSAVLPTSSATAAQEVTFTITSEGLNKEHKIYVSGGGAKIYYIGSTAELATLSTAEETVTPTVTITGGAEDTAVTIGETSVTSGSTATLTVGEEYTVTVPDGYTISSITLDDGTVDGATITPTSSTTSIEIALTEDSSGSETGYAEMGTYMFGTGATTGDYNVTSTDANVGNVEFNLGQITSSLAKFQANGITFTLESRTSVTITCDSNAIVATDENGTEYTFAKGTSTVVLPAGTYTFSSAKSGSNTSITKMVLAAVDTDTTFAIKGNVTNSAGTAVEGIVVELLDSTNTVLATATTNASGAYQFDNLTASAEYTVQTQANDTYQSATKTVTAEDATAGEEVVRDITVPTHNGSAVITVTLDGSPLAGTTVTLESDEYDYTATTDEDGEATFASVAAGTYTATVTGYSNTVDVTVTDTKVTETIAIKTVTTTLDIPFTVTNNSSESVTVYVTDSSNVTVYSVTLGAKDTETASDSTTITYTEGATLNVSSSSGTVSPNAFEVSSTNAKDGITATVTGIDTSDYTPLDTMTKYDFGTSATDGYEDDGATTIVPITSTTNDYFKLVNNSGSTNTKMEEDAIRLVQISSGTDELSFYVTEAMQIEIYVTGKDYTISMDGSTTSTSITRKKVTIIDVTPGVWVLKPGSGTSGGAIDYIKTLGVDDTDATLALTLVNNGVSGTLTVTVDGKDATSVSGDVYTFTGLGAGTHTVAVTTDSGETFTYDLTSVTITSSDDGSTISKTVTATSTANAIKVVFRLFTGTIDGESSTITSEKFTIDNTSVTVGNDADTYYTALSDAHAGDVVKFSSESKNIWKIGKAVDNGKADTAPTVSTSDMKIGFESQTSGSYTRGFEFVVPSTVAAGDIMYLDFYADDVYGKIDTYTDDGFSENLTSNSGVIGYGQYGFGGEKIEVTRNNARNYVKMQGMYGTMYEIMKSGCAYSDANGRRFADYLTEKGVEQSETLNGYTYALDRKYALLDGDQSTVDSSSYIEVTISNDITVLDGITPKLAIDGNGTTKVNGTDTEASGFGDYTYKVFDTSTNKEVEPDEARGTKRYFPVAKNTTYRIVGNDSSKEFTYIKSVRLYDPNNVFANAYTSITEPVINFGTEQDLYGSTLGTLLGVDSSSTAYNVYRLIGAVSPTDATTTAKYVDGLNGIKALGWKILPKDEVDDYLGSISYTHYAPGDARLAGDDETEAAALIPYENMTTNVILTTDMVNTGVLKMGIDDGTDSDKYENVNSTATKTTDYSADDILVGLVDGTNTSGADYTTGYAVNYVKLDANTTYYAIPFTVTDDSVLNNEDQSFTTVTGTAYTQYTTDQQSRVDTLDEWIEAMHVVTLSPSTSNE